MQLVLLGLTIATIVTLPLTLQSIGWHKKPEPEYRKCATYFFLWFLTVCIGMAMSPATTAGLIILPVLAALYFTALFSARKKAVEKQRRAARA